MALGPKLSNPSSLHWVGAFVLFQMLIMLGVGGWFGIKSGNLALNGAAAQGTVVEMTRKSSKGSTSPIVEFSTATGQRIRFEGDVASKPPAYLRGEKVTVLYSPSDPSVHVIQSFSEMWLLPSVFLPLGTAGVGAGVVMIFVGLRRKRARERVIATGWHVPANVVGAKPVRMKNSTHYEPEVQLCDPRNGEVVRGMGDRQRNNPPVGWQVVVHIDTRPPHGYFVEMR